MPYLTISNKIMYVDIRLLSKYIQLKTIQIINAKIKYSCI